MDRQEHEELMVSPVSQVNAHLAIMPVMDLASAKSRRDYLIEFTKSIMNDGHDFGSIPGTNEKKVLLKPGAEKLVTFFGLTTVLSFAEKVEDWTGVDHGGEPFFYYLARCQLFRAGNLIAESNGSCCSWESRYRYRWVSRDQVPQGLDISRLVSRSTSINELDFAIQKGETTGKYGKSQEWWDMWREAIANKKAIPITRTIREKDYRAWEMVDYEYRIANPDVYTLVNTLQKIAQKRALVGTVLIATNASEFYTQDIEDMEEPATTLDMRRSNLNVEQFPEQEKIVQSRTVRRILPTRIIDGFNLLDELTDTVHQIVIQAEGEDVGDDTLESLTADWIESYADETGLSAEDLTMWDVQEIVQALIYARSLRDGSEIYQVVGQYTLDLLESLAIKFYDDTAAKRLVGQLLTKVGVDSISFISQEDAQRWLEKLNQKVAKTMASAVKAA